MRIFLQYTGNAILIEGEINVGRFFNKNNERSEYIFINPAYNLRNIDFQNTATPTNSVLKIKICLCRQIFGAIVL